LLNRQDVLDGELLNMRRMEASLRKARALRLRFSQSLASRRQRFNQASVRADAEADRAVCTSARHASGRCGDLKNIMRDVPVHRSGGHPSPPR
jgi:hypothetical protein